jgi:hypothetical protein
VVVEIVRMLARWGRQEAIATLAWWRAQLHRPTWCAGCDGVFAFRHFGWIDNDKFRCRDCINDREEIHQ